MNSAEEMNLVEWKHSRGRVVTPSPPPVDADSLSRWSSCPKLKVFSASR